MIPYVLNYKWLNMHEFSYPLFSTTIVRVHFSCEHRNGNRLVHFCLQLVNFGLQKYCATRIFCGPLFYFSQRNYNVAYSNILGNKTVGGKKATIRCAKIIPIGQEFIKVFTMNRDFVSQNDLGRQNYVRGKIFWGRKSNLF